MNGEQATQTLHGLIEVGGAWLNTLPARVFEELLRSGAAIEEENEYEETALYAAIRNNASVKVLELLLKAGAKTEREVYLDSPDYIGSSIMYALDRSRKCNIYVPMLIKAGANPDYVDYRTGETPFMLAARRANINMCSLLVKHGANPRRLDKMGYDALRHAVDGMIGRHMKLGSPPDDIYILVDYLTGQGCDINRTSTEDGATVLMDAASHEFIYDVVKFLLKKGADPNIQDETGKTALMNAASLKLGCDVVRLLLKSGADPDIIDRDEHTALWYAAQNENPNVASLLLSELKKNPPRRPGEELREGETCQHGNHPCGSTLPQTEAHEKENAHENNRKKSPRN